MGSEKLTVRGAREHNLKNITVAIPKETLVVITGLSGSGKSSLAFDTIFAEGQRRYIESLSAYARQFLGQMKKPDVDSIEGLSPAIAIDQKGVSHNPRSTVGTVTEIYDYLRLLYARIGIPHCPQCGRTVTRQSAQEIVDALLNLPAGARFQVLAPLVRGRKGHHKPIFDEARKLGFLRVRVDGTVYDLEEVPELDRYKIHNIEAVVDRLVTPNPEEEPEENYRDLVSRVTDSVETALRLGEGILIVNRVAPQEEDLLFSEKLACPVCGISLPEIEPRTFSFNNPHGACPTCQGLGYKQELDVALIIPNPEKSLNDGAIAVGLTEDRDSYTWKIMDRVAEHFHIPMDKPWNELTDEQRNIILYGSGRETVYMRFEGPSGAWEGNRPYEGIIPNLQRRYDETNSDYIRGKIEEAMSHTPCNACHGTRLRAEARAVTIGDMPIHTISHWPAAHTSRWIEEILANNTLTAKDYTIAERPLREIRDRLRFLVDVGLEYLSMDRPANTLSGGEAQRIRLATQVGSKLTGVLYVLDEPSIGLHQRDTARLIRTLKELRDLGNTVLVVEHDDETIRAADWIIDLGPGAGEHGGHIMAEGTLSDILVHPNSITGIYLSGRKSVPVPAQRRAGNGKSLLIRNARSNNLKNVDARIPLGMLTCVTGVSGSGKSSLVVETLSAKLSQMLYNARTQPGECDGLDGIENIDKAINIDQSPIGRTPRSNPATYAGLFGPIRELFAALPESKLRGYTPGRFSFNVKGGRCEACEGEGTLRIEMQFLPDVYVPCDVCHGTRYNRETLQVRYKEHNIAEVLDLTVDEGLEFFAAIPSISNKLKTLHDVGLGYIRLGQPAPTLSGGEAQRVKLSKELSRRATGRTLYILDEPTVGLHAADVDRLIEVLQRLTDTGNSIVVIEHNPDVIKVSDWIIDMGPDGGDAGGQIVAQGTPEEVAGTPGSYTGQYLKEWLHQPAPEPVGK